MVGDGEVSSAAEEDGGLGGSGLEGIGNGDACPWMTPDANH